MAPATLSTQLREQISQYFNDEELRTLCVDVGGDYDDLGGQGKRDKVRELVAWAERRGQLDTLLAAVKGARPGVAAIANLLPSHHIPFHPNELFTGREAALAELAQRLGANGTAATTVALTGLGGMGKTQVALAYCYRHLASYDLVYWLPADEPTTLGVALAEMAYRLGLAPRSVGDHGLLRQQVLTWLATTAQRWLLVFDNADQIDPAALRPFLPKLGNGANLITTRNPNWGGLAQMVPLAQVSEEEAVAFLLGGGRQAAQAAAEAAQAATEAAQLAAVLGYLPLALEHARAYVAATGCSLADYAGYLAAERRELWAEVAPPADYAQRTVTTTWELAFAQVQQTAGAAALLNVCCFLAAEAVPLSLLAAAQTAEGVPEPLRELAESQRKLDGAIAALRRYSLLQRDGDAVVVHRLVQLVAQDRLPPEQRQTWLQAAVALLRKAWPFKEYQMETWGESGRLLPHLLAVLAVANGEGMEETAVAVLNGHADSYLSYLGNYATALPYSRRALAIRENTLGSDHPDVAIHLNNLGVRLHALGEYEAARPLMERALSIDEKALGSDHPSVATDLNNLGLLLHALGEYDAARPLLQRALAIWEKALGSDHPQVAAGCNSLGQLLKALGEYDAARPFLQRALDILTAKLGEGHPHTQIVRHNLAALPGDS